jgi:hypothetical protein
MTSLENTKLRKKMNEENKTAEKYWRTSRRNENIDLIN